MAAFLRRSTFHLPHARGDQNHYIGLAYKLARHGVGDYTLRGLDLVPVPGAPDMLVFTHAPGRGPLVDALLEDGHLYYDVPLFQTPYGFPALLVLSHAAFGETAYGVLHADDASAEEEGGLRAHRFAPGVARHQRWSVAVPFAASLLLVALTFALALRWFASPLVATVAALLVAVSPADLLTSQRIWADDVTAACVVATVLLFDVARRGHSGWIALAAGLACGAGVVTKHTAGFVVPALLVWHVGARGSALARLATWRRSATDRVAWCFALGLVVASGHWFWMMASAYGDPLHLPSREALGGSDWMRLVAERPRALFLVGIPWQNPFFALVVLAPLALLLAPSRRAPVALGLLWIGAYLAILAAFFPEGREHRYMLPAYPACAALAAFVGVGLRDMLAERVPRPVATALLVLALVASAAWSVDIGLEAVDHGRGLIRQPW